MATITSHYNTITWDMQQATSIGNGAECEVFSSSQLDDNMVAKLPFTCDDHPFDTHEGWVNMFMDNALKAYDMDAGPRVLGMVLNTDGDLIGYITERVRTTDDIIQDIFDYTDIAYVNASPEDTDALDAWQYSLQEEPGEAICSFDTVEALLHPNVKQFVEELEQIDLSLYDFMDMGFCDMHMWNVGLLNGEPITIDHGPYSRLQDL
mgnify:CR=1 FL=1